jgi:hypothetical protein
MPNFTERFAEEVRRQQVAVARAFSSAPLSDVEQALRERVAVRWQTLPSEAPVRSPVFATDGSQAVRHFNNGWLVIVAQALLVGPNCQEPLVDVRFARASLPEPVTIRYTGLLMRRLELEAAGRAVPRVAGGILYTDGSLWAGIPHLLYPLAVVGEEDLPLAVLEAYLDLLDACVRNEVLLLGISKTTAASTLTEALLTMDDVDFLPTEVEPPAVEAPCDAEILYRWTSGTGFTVPLLLGVHALGQRRAGFLSSLEEIARSFDVAGGQRYRRAELLQLLERLRESSAMLTMHFRLSPAEETLRVDLPAHCVGMVECLRDLYMGWAAPERAREVAPYLMASYGGSRVYNAPIYVADQLVRLSASLMDGAYLSVLRDALGEYVQYDRSRRRFL